MTNDKQWFNRATVEMREGEKKQKQTVTSAEGITQNGQLNTTDPINHIHSLNLIQAQ